jgi:hypothetical protein
MSLLPCLPTTSLREKKRRCYLKAFRFQKCSHSSSLSTPVLLDYRSQQSWELQLSDKYQVPTLQHFGSTWIGEHWTVESDAQIYMSGLRHPGSEPQGEQCLQLIDTHARDALTHLHVLQDKTIDAILSREGLCILEHELVDTLLAWVEQSKKSVESVMSMLFKHSLKLLQCTGKVISTNSGDRKIRIV